jgi:hypothetical protein
MSRRVFIVDGSPVRAGPAYGWAEEFSILRGKLVIGLLRAYTRLVAGRLRWSIAKGYVRKPRS